MSFKCQQCGRDGFLSPHYETKLGLAVCFECWHADQSSSAKRDGSIEETLWIEALMLSKRQWPLMLDQAKHVETADEVVAAFKGRFRKTP